MAKNKKTLDELLQEAIVKDAPYEVPGNWIKSNLNSIMKFEKGKKPKVLLDECKENAIPYVTIKCFESNKPNQYTFLSETNKVCEKDDVIVVWDGARAGLVGMGSYGALGSTLCKIKCNKLNNKYIYYYFLGKYDLINVNTKGTGIPHVNPEFLKTLTFPVPPLKEQERIAEKIESLFKKLDKAKELIEEVRGDFEKRKAAILEKAFRGELTEKWREENNILNESNINENLPCNWKWSRLIDTCEIIMGQSPKGISYNDEGKGIPLINGPVEFGNSYFSKTIKSKWTTKPTKMCLNNDLLLCVRGSTLGRINIAGFDACIGRGVAAIRSRIYQKYINYKIHFIRNKIYSIGTGTTFPNISRKQIGELDIEFPPLEEQKEIVRILDKLLDEENKIEKITNLQNQIELTKKSILAKSFRGELGTNNPGEESAIELLKEVLQEKL